MLIGELISWHIRSGNRAELDQKNARRKSLDLRSSQHTIGVWQAEVIKYQDLVIFHRNAVKLLESINHDKTI